MRLGREALGRVCRELRQARLDRGLSLAEVAAAVGVSVAVASRIERERLPRVAFITLATYAAVVGLDLVVNTYAGPSVIRDQGHARLLDDFEAELHPSLRFPREVPFPNPGDQRAWDGMVIGPGWRFGIEAETAPTDAQALARRISLKLRDGNVDGVLLVLRDTRRSQDFLTAARGELASAFPVPARRALAGLRSGRRPEGNAIVVLHHRRKSTPTT
ncbi:MAG: helix-turn-helix domain-containing protein [Chloroflexi bacterium]|nr:helix-turn-helix domain-containing protein [Chloroflexota bacterium]